MMTGKALAMEAIRGLPEDASIQEIRERFDFLATLEKGVQDLEEGRVVSHEDVKKNLGKWLSK